jgi:hypothetical protein
MPGQGTPVDGSQAIGSTFTDNPVTAWGGWARVVAFAERPGGDARGGTPVRPHLAACHPAPPRGPAGRCPGPPARRPSPGPAPVTRLFRRFPPATRDRRPRRPGAGRPHPGGPRRLRRGAPDRPGGRRAGGPGEAGDSRRSLGGRACVPVPGLLSRLVGAFPRRLGYAPLRTLAPRRPTRFACGASLGAERPPVLPPLLRHTVAGHVPRIPPMPAPDPRSLPCRSDDSGSRMRLPATFGGSYQDGHK